MESETLWEVGKWILIIILIAVAAFLLFRQFTASQSLVGLSFK